GGKGKRISVILPDPEDEESDAEGTNLGEQDKMLLEIRQEIRQIRQTVRDIIRDELQSTLKFYSNKIDDYEEKIKDYDMRVKLMENQCKNLTNTCKNLSLKNELLEQKINKLEQTQSSNDLEICGVGEKENEDVKQISTSLCQLLNQNTEDVLRVYRKKKPSRQGTAQAERARADAPIIVSLREGRRDYWIEAAKTAKISAQLIGGEGEHKVYLRESLSPMTAYLLWKTKTSLKEKSLCKYVWCKNGVIMVRITDRDKKIFYVRSESDIEKIKKEILHKQASLMNC
ncbi:jg25259, partial [Pararge aegeria aegeria]